MNTPQPDSKKKPFLSRGLWPLVNMLAIASLSFASHAASLTYTVDSSGDGPVTGNSSTCNSPCTLRAAIHASNMNPDADTINIPDGFPLITLSYFDADPKAADENATRLGDLDINGDLTINGESSTGRNVIAASFNKGVGNRVFHIHNGFKVTFTNISIKGGRLSIETVKDINNKDIIIGKPAGAGILIEASSTVTLDNVEVTENTISKSTAADYTTVGGGIFVADQAILTITDSVISKNEAPSGGGINNAGRTDIRRSLIDANKATDDNDATLASASGGGGGGINNQGGYLTLGTSTLSNNSSTQLGGGLNISNQGLNNGNVIISNSVIFNNHAEFGGSGIANVGPLSINNSAIVGNSAASIITDGSRGNGAGIFNLIGSLDMVNSTVSHNLGAHSGGGIFSYRDVNLTNVTIYDNEATPCTSGADCTENSRLGGNQIALFNSNNSNPRMALSNTIIANGPDSNGTEPPCSGSTGYLNYISSQGNNLENANTCGLVHSTDQPDIADLHLHLAALDNDPNRPAETEKIGNDPTNTLFAARQVNALEAASTAIDKGGNDSCPLVDQRYMLRIAPCDIGAYEYNAGAQQTNNMVDLKATITDTPDPVAPNQTLTYRIVVSNLYVDTPADVVRISIALPSTYTVNPLGINSTATGSIPVCAGPDDATNTVICTASSISGLGRVEISISGSTSQLQGTITARVDVYSNTLESFTQNNVNITADTVIDPDANKVDNFGGGSGGGGAFHPFTLLLTALILLSRRFRTAAY